MTPEPEDYSAPWKAVAWFLAPGVLMAIALGLIVFVAKSAGADPLPAAPPITCTNGTHAATAVVDHHLDLTANQGEKTE